MQLRLSNKAAAAGTRRDGSLAADRRRPSARAGGYWIGVAPGGAPFWVAATAAVDW